MNRFVVAAGIVAGFALGAPAVAQTKPTIPVIVKATTSLYWQTVLAGARKAGQDLGVDVTGLGAQSESDIAGQISILQKAVASNPAAIVIAPAQFAALGKPIDEAAKKVKIIGIDSAADTKTLTSLVAVDEVQAGRIAADALANAITKTYADTEGNVAIITASPGASRDQSAEGFKEQVAKKYRALSVLPDKVADAQEATGFSIMKELTATDRNLRGVFALRDILGLRPQFFSSCGFLDRFVYGLGDPLSWRTRADEAGAGSAIHTVYRRLLSLLWPPPGMHGAAHLLASPRQRATPASSLQRMLWMRPFIWH
jgi:ribose transport system substrate-binding protein